MLSRIGVIAGLVLVLVLGLYTVVQNGKDGPVEMPVTVTDEATMVTFEHLPVSLQDHLSEADVSLILALELDYIKQNGMEQPPPAAGTNAVPALDMNAMAAFIRDEAAHRGTRFTLEQIRAVLAAEDEYLRQEGMVEAEDQ